MEVVYKGVPGLDVHREKRNGLPDYPSSRTWLAEGKATIRHHD